MNGSQLRRNSRSKVPQQSFVVADRIPKPKDLVDQRTPATTSKSLYQPSYAFPPTSTVTYRSGSKQKNKAQVVSSFPLRSAIAAPSTSKPRRKSVHFAPGTLPPATDLQPITGIRIGNQMELNNHPPSRPRLRRHSTGSHQNSLPHDTSHERNTTNHLIAKPGPHNSSSHPRYLFRRDSRSQGH